MQPPGPAELARACADFHRTTRRSLLARGADRIVPVPNDVLLEGSAGFLGQRRTRREFLLGGIGAFVALSAAGRLTPWELVERAAAADGSGPILVTLFLGGGNDGLNTVLPLEGADRAVYERSRPRLGIDPGEALGIGDQPHLGWHPAVGGLKQLYDQGLLRVFLSVDHDRPDFSHFHETKIWRSADQDYQHASTGWLGRYLDEVGTPDNPLQGVAVNWATDDILLSRQAPSCALFSPGDFDFWSPDVWDTDAMLAAYRTLGGPGRNAAHARAVEVARESVTVREALTPLREEEQAEGGPPAPPVGYPDSDTGRGLRNLARMLGAGLGIRVATASSSGMFDTHADQPGQMESNLADLGAALVAFQADVDARGLGGRVLTLVWSEFGRRIEDNDSNGTDHGSGGLLLAAGRPVAGGFANPEWALGDPTATDGNIPVQLDFRDVYAGVLEQHLGIEAARVLPGYRGTPLTVAG